MKQRKANIKNRAGYSVCKPKQFGNLHARMKYLMEQLYRVEGCNSELLENGLRNAIFDLESEVSYYRPENPPYGSRLSRM